MITQEQVANWVQQHNYLWHNVNENVDPFDAFQAAAYRHIDSLSEDDREEFLEHLYEELV